MICKQPSKQLWGGIVIYMRYNFLGNFLHKENAIRLSYIQSVIIIYI